MGVLGIQKHYRPKVSLPEGAVARQKATAEQILSLLTRSFGIVPSNVHLGGRHSVGELHSAELLTKLEIQDRLNCLHVIGLAADFKHGKDNGVTCEFSARIRYPIYCFNTTSEYLKQRLERFIEKFAQFILARISEELKDFRIDLGVYPIPHEVKNCPEYPVGEELALSSKTGLTSVFTEFIIAGRIR